MNTRVEGAAVPTRWLLRYLRPHWVALSAGTVVMAARAGALALAPWPLKYIVDSVIYSGPLPPLLAAYLPDTQSHRVMLLGVLCVLTLGFGVADALLDYIGNKIFLDAGQRLVFALRRDLFSHLQKLSLDFHRRNSGGDLMSRLNGDVQKLQDLISAVGGDFIQHILVMAGIAAMMLSVDWRYALVVLAALPVLFGIIQIYTALLRRAIRRMRLHEGDLWNMAQEMLGSIQLVQAYGREAHEEQRFDVSASKIFRAGKDVNSLQAQFSPALTAAVAAATGLIAWYGAIRVLHGQLTAGEMLVFLAYFRSLTTPTRRIAKTSRMVGRASVALERIAEHLFETPSVVEASLAVTPRTCTGRIELECVSFGYASGPNILHDVSFCLEPGKSIALVGPTGAGKSTIAGLISRFYDPVHGRVLLDGQDFRGLGLGFVRRQVALVLQEPVIFRASVWENICYGLEGSGREDAIAAAEAVGVDAIIRRLPGGYDCMVSERGQTLSGGQRQCISIARAMLSNAPIIVLDEPSSSLDAMTECLIMDALTRLTANRASLTIAHRLKTVSGVDEILVLDQGRIVQRGCHAQLREEGGVYGSLWASFADGRAEDALPLVARRTA